MEYEAASTGFSIGWGLIATIVLLGVGLFAIILAKMFRRVVEPNEVHIVQSSGKTTIYGKQRTGDGEDGKVSNSYFEWPSWWPVIGVQSVVLPLSVFELQLKSYEAYDIGKVPFVVDIVAFFRIEDAAVAAKRVSSLQELEAQLTAILQGAVRTILAKHEIEHIMEERSTYGQNFTDEVKEQLKAWGVVNVKNIELMDIRDGMDSKTVSNIMAKKESLIEKESRTEVAANIRDAEIAEINAKRETEVQAQAAEQKIGERTAEKDKNVGIANELAQQEIKEQARATAEKDMAVQKVNDVRAAEIAKDVRIVKAEEQKQVDITETEGVKAQTILKAEGDLKDAQLNAEGIQAVGEAEAEAKRLNEMATVTPQIELAREIGENEGYQTYLIEIRAVEKDEAVGREQAKALQDAGIKVIANAGNVSTGVDNVMDLFSSKGGTALGGALEGLANTPQGQAVLSALGINSTEEEPTPAPRASAPRRTPPKKQPPAGGGNGAVPSS